MAAPSQAAPAAARFNPSEAPDAASGRSPSSATRDEVESPSLSNTSTALARFEFEAGRSSQNGTKILMVEWEDDETTRDVRGDWHISWEGKKTVLPAGDKDTFSENGLRRLYFMLPPGTTIPSIVTLTLQPTGGDVSASSPIIWHTNPLPAIFPPELGASARGAGKKGVLHTIWAKKRLQVLQAEIEAESRVNVEGVGFVMAVQEREWIEKNFGVARPLKLGEASSPGGGLLEPSGSGSGGSPMTPSSPRSPGGSRLMDKLKGLKLGTSDRDLSSSGGGTGGNPLSPDSTDVAISSFSAIKGMQPLPAQSRQPQQQPQQQRQTSLPSRNVTAQAPPASLLAQQQRSTGLASLDALTGGGQADQEEEREEQGLFALPMSPRSGSEISKGPFSFAGGDTRKYVDSGRVV